MKKLLIMTYDLPYPPDAGGKTRAYNMIKFLSKSFDITLVSFVREDGVEEKIEHLKKYCSAVYIVRRRKVWTFENLFRTLLSDRPLAIHVYESKEMRTLLRNLQEAQKYDYALLESFYTSGYINSFSDTKLILGTENLEYFFYKRYVDNVKLFPLRVPMYLDVAKMKRFEEDSWKKSDVVLAVSEVDAQIMRERTKSPVLVVPNAVDVDFFDEVKPEGHEEKRALFVGSWKYIQNIDAAQFLIKEIWPEVLKRSPDLKLWLVGKNPPPRLTKLATDSIEFKSGIDDIREAYANVDLSVIPIRAASGTRLKALESLAARVPVVSTSIGVEGIELINTKSVLLAETPAEFADAVEKLLRDPKQRADIIDEAYKIVRQKYSWRSVIAELQRNLDEI